MTTGLHKTQSNTIWLSFYLILLILIIDRPVVANEMPLEGFPANGIVVRDERNMLMEREELYIKSNKIEVSYVFRNLSDKDITSEVAFPIPSYEYERNGMPYDINYPVYSDFTVEVNGIKKEYGEISRALIDGKDVTEILNGLNISIKDFNESRWGYGSFSRNFFKQSKSVQQKLLDKGVVQVDEYYEGIPHASPAWSVETTFFWTQVFPAHSVIRIKHTYKPNPSHTKNPGEDKDFINRSIAIDPRKAYVSEILCFDDELKQWEKQLTSQMNTAIIDYILTTANHWKKPIKEFHLIVEAESRTDRSDERVSTCFERNKLKKINNHRYEMTIKDFEPKEEISVFFVTGDIGKY